jgi:hypothetical protein
VVFLRAEEVRRLALFRFDVERFLVEDLRAPPLRLVDFRALLFARLDDPERLRVAPPFRRPAERFVPDDFRAAMVHISCFGGSPCCVRKNRAQSRLPVAGTQPGYHQRLTKNGEEMQCGYVRSQD